MWHIENRLPWVRDETFSEDLNRVRTGPVPQTMAALQKLDIYWQGACRIGNIAAAFRENAANPQLFFALLGKQNN